MNVHKPLTSNNDQRLYRAHTLSNGLVCLLVCDSQSRCSAVSMAVQEGHFNDPRHIEGLAHMLEHTIFLGSKDYPQANYLSNFLSSHGGSLNAWTGTEQSNFHFNVAPEHLVSSLEIFADMLCNPSFDTASIENEINAIDAEFKLKQKDDLRRLYQVHKETCNPLHPFSKFSVGNRQTFTSVPIESLKKALIDLHQNTFLAQNMRLSVISSHDLDSQQQMVEQLFSNLPKVSAPASPKPLPDLYLKQHLGIQINIRPIKIARRMIVSFALPDVQKLYKSKPLEYISHMLGDEGSGSLLVYLKAKNWATNLSAGGGIDGSNFKDFNLNLQLTQEGTRHIEDILNCIFYYIQLIEDGLTDTWRLKEQAQLAELAFQYSEPSKPLDDAVHIANQLFHYPIEDLLSGDYLVQNLDTGPIQACLNKMCPDNMRIKFISPDVETNKVAKWYETPYSVSPIPAETLAKLQSPTKIEELKLTRKNPYLVDRTDPQPTNEQYSIPSIISQQSSSEIWFGQDTRFTLPKGDIYISFDCAAVEQGVQISAYKRLWVALMLEHINHHYYCAGVAGLHHHLYPHQAGFSLHTSGFSEKQMTLCLDLFSNIHEKHNFTHIFEQVQNKHFNALQNALLNKPVNRLFTRLSGIIQRYNHAPSELLPYVKNAKLSDIENVRDTLLSRYFLEGLVYGDWSAQQAQSFANKLASHEANPGNGAKIKRDVANLTQHNTFLHQVDSQHDDAAVVLYFQSPSISNKDIALTILVEQLLAVPFFNTMRTERQLGYMVGSGYLPINQHPGMAFYIQSPTHNARDLVHQMQHYLEQLLDNVEEYSEIWPHVRESVIKQLNNNDTSLTVKSQRLWMAIGNEDHQFNQQQSLAISLAALTYNDVEAFFQKMKSQQEFGNLVLFCAGKHVKDIPEDGTFIYDIQNFKATTDFML